MHRVESRGCGDVFIWFGGPPNKSFKGPHVLCPLLIPNTGLPLVQTAIKPVFNLFLSSLWVLGKTGQLQCIYIFFSRTSFGMTRESGSVSDINWDENKFSRKY